MMCPLSAAAGCRRTTLETPVHKQERGSQRRAAHVLRWRAAGDKGVLGIGVGIAPAEALGSWSHSGSTPPETSGRRPPEACASPLQRPARRAS